MEMNKSIALLLETELKHLYKAEKESYESLEVFAEHAVLPKLKEAFLNHLIETKNQIERLNRVFEILSIDKDSSKLHASLGLKEKGIELTKAIADFNFTDKSKGMSGIVSESKELLRHFAKTEAIDMALTSAAQKEKHFEIACYKVICKIAEQHDLVDIFSMMRRSLNEEMQMVEKLDKIASIKTHQN